MKRKFHILKLSGILFFILVFQQDALGQFYNGTQTSFGKNRVQYQNFKWQYYRFQNFETYFYTGGKKLAKHTAQYANQRIEQLEQFLDFYLDEPLQFIIFNKQSQFRQSNIGLSSSDNYNIGGVTNIVDYKVFIYFNGSYSNFEKQIDAGILRVLINQMIYGGNWREVLKNSALMSMPEWYVEGLISYLVHPKDPLINARIKDGILNNEFKKFNALSSEKAKIAGHSMWEYVANTYGQNVISNILYMTKISREIDDGFLYVIGMPFKELYSDWANYYDQKYNNENTAKNNESAIKKTRKNRRYQNFKLGPNNRYLSYTTNKLGKYKIYLYDKETDKRQKIYAAEHKLERLQDYSYPVVNFHPSGKLLAFITEDKNEVFLYQYNIEEEELSHKPILKIDKVLSFDYRKDGQQMIFSAVAKGQSDLYLYNIIGNTQEALTDDIYTDLNPTFSDDGNTIFFSSNRPNESLNTDHREVKFREEMDIFAYQLNADKNKIKAVTNSLQEDEKLPISNDGYVYYLKHQDGKTIRYQSKYDSSVSRIDTAIHYRYFYKTTDKKTFDNLILEHDINAAKNYGKLEYENQRYQLYTQQLNQQSSLKIGKEQKEIFSKRSHPQENRKLLKSFEEKSAVPPIDFDNYSFEEKEIQVKKEKKATLQKAKIDTSKELKFPTQRLYQLNFTPDNSILQLNNQFITQQYQQFNGGPYINPGVGVNLKIGIVDLMEDHRVYGGFRYSGNLIEYSLNYQNLSKRLDKEYRISRRRLRETGSAFPYDVKTLKATTSLIWPFNEVSSLRGIISARNDKNIPLSSNQFNLEREITNNYWGSIKAAYVFDNTRNVALNIRYGTRYKIFAEQYQLLYKESENSSTDLTVFGFDFRHYQKIHRELIGVFRFAGSKSIGSNPLIYYMGGVDEWWKSDIFDRNTPIDYGMNYGFQALAANMRGFLQNVRNGNNFAVINTELRLPVFSYLINRPIQSSFIRNFQIVGFGDVGTAWVGDSPFNKANPIIDESQVTGPIKVTYENINNPIVGGIGFGLRTTLLGYFVRADWGWGIENGLIADKPLFMLSLSLDI